MKWELNLKKFLPKCSSETFLRELAVFAEEHTPEWSKDFLQHQIQSRIHRPRSRKDPWLTSRDLVITGDLATWQKRRITEVKEEDDASSLSAGEGEAATPTVAERNVRVDLNSENSGTLPLSSPLPQLAAPAPPLSSTGSSGSLPAENPRLVVPR